MWKQLLEFGKQLIALTRDVQQNKGDIKELREELKDIRQEIKDLSERVDRLVDITQRLALALEHHRDVAARDRENLLLRVRKGRHNRFANPGPSTIDH